MTPKEKAIDLYEKFIFPCWECDEFARAKECALIAVDEMLGEYQSMSDLESKIVINDEVRFIVHQLQYWMLVKLEI